MSNPKERDPKKKKSPQTPASTAKKTKDSKAKPHPKRPEPETDALTEFLAHATLVPGPNPYYEFHYDMEKELREALAKAQDAELISVHLRLNPEQAAELLFCDLHPSQKITMLEDGSMDLEMTVPYIHMLIRWILGRQAVVLEPHFLRDLIRAEWQAILKRHED